MGGSQRLLFMVLVRKDMLLHLKWQSKEQMYYIIDESTPSAISLKAEIAKTYPNVASSKGRRALVGNGTNRCSNIKS